MEGCEKKKIAKYVHRLREKNSVEIVLGNCEIHQLVSGEKNVNFVNWLKRKKRKIYQMFPGKKFVDRSWGKKNGFRPLVAEKTKLESINLSQGRKS